MNRHGAIPKVDNDGAGVFRRRPGTASSGSSEKMTRKNTKKATPVFGQLTLTGEMALDWLKNDMKIPIVKIEIGPIGAFPGWNVPDWAMERAGDIALLHKPGKFDNPVLVTQRSVLRHLEVICVEKETQGALTDVVKVDATSKAVLELPEGDLTLHFIRDHDKGKYAPYEVYEIE